MSSRRVQQHRKIAFVFVAMYSWEGALWVDAEYITGLERWSQGAVMKGKDAGRDSKGTLQHKMKRYYHSYIKYRV